MSSDYHALCVSHDPAIVIDGGWRQPEQALAAVARRQEHEALRVHAACDLLIGRYSYPLIEVCCPGGNHPPLLHPAERWVDADWLRLLHYAYLSKDAEMLAAAQSLQCWSAMRVGRLRVELGVADVAKEAAATDRAEELAEASGYVRAIAVLRDDERYRRWWSSNPGELDGRYWDGPGRRHLADYLEVVAKDWTTRREATHE